jgi:hypothetical protein
LCLAGLQQNLLPAYQAFRGLPGGGRQPQINLSSVNPRRLRCSQPQHQPS